MDKRNRLSPVTLTVECPVLHLVLNALVSDALFLKNSEHLCDGILLVCESVKDVGVNHLSVACIGFLFNVSALYNFNDIYAEFLREIIVSLIVSRNSHDSSCSIAHHYIVRDKYRDLLSCNRIYSLKTCNLYAGLILYKLSSLELCLLGSVLSILQDLIPVCNLVLVLIKGRMLRSNNHEGYSVKGIASCGIDLKLIENSSIAFIRKLEVNECTRGTSDPAYLLLLDAFRILNVIKTIQKSVCIFCDLQVPDILWKLNYIAVADITLTAL